MWRHVTHSPGQRSKQKTDSKAWTEEVEGSSWRKRGVFSGLTDTRKLTCQHIPEGLGVCKLVSTAGLWVPSKKEVKALQSYTQPGLVFTEYSSFEPICKSCFILIKKLKIFTRLLFFLSSSSSLRPIRWFLIIEMTDQRLLVITYDKKESLSIVVKAHALHMPCIWIHPWHYITSWASLGKVLEILKHCWSGSGNPRHWRALGTPHSWHSLLNC